MSSIGSYTFARMEGMVDPAKFRVEDITRPNVAGVAFWPTGYKGGPFTLTTVTLASNAAAVVAAIEAYTQVAVASTFTVTDDIGNAYTNIFIIDCTPVKQGLLISPTTAGVGAYVVCQWTMIDVSTG